MLHIWLGAIFSEGMQLDGPDGFEDFLEWHSFFVAIDKSINDIFETDDIVCSEQFFNESIVCDG